MWKRSILIFRWKESLLNKILRIVIGLAILIILKVGLKAILPKKLVFDSSDTLWLYSLVLDYTQLYLKSLNYNLKNTTIEYIILQYI